jgi:hypothetical protein
MIRSALPSQSRAHWLRELVGCQFALGSALGATDQVARVTRRPILNNVAPIEDPVSLEKRI